MEYSTSKETILKLAETGETARELLEALFPQAFEGEKAVLLIKEGRIWCDGTIQGLVSYQNNSEIYLSPQQYKWKLEGDYLTATEKL